MGRSLAFAIVVLVWGLTGVVAADTVQDQPAAAVASIPPARGLNAVKTITVRAARDMGYFAGDLIKADIEIQVEDGYMLEDASLPHAGPVNYWLDLLKIDVTSRLGGGSRRYNLKILYQNFYDALDARPQEIPTFPVTFSKGIERVTANVPAWTIGVSALREVAPPIKEDPKDYLRADAPAPLVDTGPLWRNVGAAALATLVALAILARDRAWRPFHARPARVFAAANRRLRTLAHRAEDEDAYLDALLVLHRGIDATDGRRVLADDVPAFLARHAVFSPLRDSFLHFFAASRSAFFGSDPARARHDLGFGALQTFARQLAAIERVKS